MSTFDEQGQTGEGAAGQAAEKSSFYGLGNGAAGFIILFFMLGLIASLLVGWVLFPKLLYSQKEQPAAFSHALHNDLVDNGCQSCHYFREDGSFSGAPTLAECITCHDELLGISEDERHFVETYVAPGLEVPWLIYARQPDCVFFSHAAHVLNARMDCKTCHGYIGTSDELPIYEENRISGYSRNVWGENISGIKYDTWDSMKMSDCAACHAEAKLMAGSVQTKKDGCFVCHK